MNKYKMKKDTQNFIKEEYEKCIGCKKCMKGCPMLAEFCENPKQLLHELSASSELDKRIPYSCMLCGYCEEVCPKSVSFKKICFKLREDLDAVWKSNPPKDLNLKGVKMHQSLSFSPLFSKALKTSKNTVFFPGCALMSMKPEIVKKVNSYLNEKMDGCSLMTHCCGKPTRYMGQKEKFQDNIENIQRELESKHVKVLIAGCLNCYISLKESLKDIEVLSLWPVLNSLEIGKERKSDLVDLDLVPALHDPCPTREYDEIHQSVRDILSDMKIKYCEMEFNKRETLCCGAGAMVSVAQKDISDRHTKRRCNQAKTDYIITYCQECTDTFKRYGKKSFHILDILFSDFKDLDFQEIKLSTKWKNRFLLSNGRKYEKDQ